MLGPAAADASTASTDESGAAGRPSWPLLARWTTIPQPGERPMHQRTLYRLTWLAAALSLGHHLDHIIRHNAVGWPLTDQVNAFTLSLGIYPVIATGLLLYHAGRVGPGSWALVSGGGAVFVSTVHFGPAAVEPPEMILDPYDPPILGWLAFAWLVAFVTVLAVTCVYETRVWSQQRQARRAGRPATDAGIQQ
jgi:hypothetical protein